MPGLCIPSKVHYIIDARTCWWMVMTNSCQNERCAARSLLGICCKCDRRHAHTAPTAYVVHFWQHFYPRALRTMRVGLWEKGHTMLQCRWWRLDAVRQRNNNMRNEHAQWCEHRVQARNFYLWILRNSFACARQRALSHNTNARGGFAVRRAFVCVFAVSVRPASGGPFLVWKSNRFNYNRI